MSENLLKFQCEIGIDEECESVFLNITFLV